jgi:CHASE3 domain sensor protein
MVMLCIAIGLVSYLQSRVVSDKIREITEVREPVNTAVHGMESSLEQTGLATLGFLSTGDAGFMESFQTSRNAFEEYDRKYGAAGGADPGVKLRQGFKEFCAQAADQIELRNLQSRNMSALLKEVDEIEGLLNQGGRPPRLPTGTGRTPDGGQRQRDDEIARKFPRHR